PSSLMGCFRAEGVTAPFGEIRECTAMVADVSFPTPPPPEVQDDVLRIDGLSVEFFTEQGWTKVVDDVSLSVPVGTTVGLVGESGSGKTVTSLAVMGLLPPHGSRVTGSIRLAGRETVGLNERQLSDIRGADVSM